MIPRTKMLEAALSYAEKGLPVFPLQFKSKVPGTTNGVKDATTDFVQINKWWQEAPYANIGIAMGNGLIAIDIDVDRDKGEDGFESIRDWEKEHGELPETVMTLTGRGGNHMIYATNTPCGNRTGVLHGVDVRSDGGYIVAPPSLHPNGSAYVWENEFGDCEIAEANKSVMELVTFGLKKDEQEEQNGDGERFTLPTIIKNGERNDTLFRYACSLQSKGYDDKDIMKLVLLANEKNCETSYDGRELTELKKSIRSALAHPKGTSERPKIKLETVAGDDLQRMDLKPPEFLVSEILPIGVCILGAPPKAGKSWFVLDLALSVARGNKFLGHETTQGEVLYLSLEDSLYRLKQRTLKVLGNEPIPRNIHFAIQAPTIDIDKQNEGLMGEITSYMAIHPQTSLIIIDTLQMVQSKQGKNEDAYSHTYKLLNAIRPIFTKYNACVMLVHHTRKASKDDTEPFETFLGSQALAGATDGMYIIKKKFKDEVGTLYGRGRDFEEFEFAIKRDKNTCKWMNLGEADDIEDIKVRESYESSPITITIKYKLEKLLKDNAEMVKDYVVTAKEMKNEVYDYTGEYIGRNEKAFMTEVTKLDGMLYRDGIIHEAPCGRTTYKGKPGLYHRFRYKQIKEN